MQNNSDMARLLQLAQSPAGQQLLTLLQETGGDSLQQALAKAAAGDYAEAKQAVATMLESKEAQALLAQLGGSL